VYPKILLCALLLLTEPDQFMHKNILILFQHLNLPFQSKFPNFQGWPQQALLTFLLMLHLLGL
jgi:hypothetical protein